jgi:hypothetical protein
VRLFGGDLLVDLLLEHRQRQRALLAEGELLTLDGRTGSAYRGAATAAREVSQDLLERLRQLRRDDRLRLGSAVRGLPEP